MLETKIFLLKIEDSAFLYTSGFATTHVVVSVRHPTFINLPIPYQPPKYVEDSYWRNKIDR